MIMKKHAFIIIANSVSKVLVTCVEMLDNPFNDIYILFDKKANLMHKSDLLRKIVKYSRMSFCEQIVNWGGIRRLVL